MSQPEKQVPTQKPSTKGTLTKEQIETALAKKPKPNTNYNQVVEELNSIPDKIPVTVKKITEEELKVINKPIKFWGQSSWQNIRLQKIHALKPSLLHDEFLVQELKQMQKITSHLSSGFRSYFFSNQELQMGLREEYNFFSPAQNMDFFYNKGEYLHKRQKSIIQELELRGLAKSIDQDLRVFDDKSFKNLALYNDWTPSQKDLDINKRFVKETIGLEEHMFNKTKAYKEDLKLISSRGYRKIQVQKYTNADGTIMKEVNSNLSKLQQNEDWIQSYFQGLSDTLPPKEELPKHLHKEKDLSEKIIRLQQERYTEVEIGEIIKKDRLAIRQEETLRLQGKKSKDPLKKIDSKSTKKSIEKFANLEDEIEAAEKKLKKIEIRLEIQKD